MDRISALNRYKKEKEKKIHTLAVLIVTGDGT